METAHPENLTHDTTDTANTTTNTTDVPDAAAQELLGWRIGVTAARRGTDLCQALERHGAQVVHAPALSLVPAAHDVPVITATQAILQRRPQILLVATGYGLRRWLETADATGLGENLREVMSALDMIVRGPKAAGQVAALDLEPKSLTVVNHLDDGVRHILTDPSQSLRRCPVVALQLAGTQDHTAVQQLQRAGREVQAVVPYRLQQADRPTVTALIQETCARRLDAVVFTAAPSVDSVLAVARETGLYGEFLRALGGGSVLPAVVGEVCARPLREVGVEPLIPERPRMAAVVRKLCEHAQTQRLDVLTAHGPLQLRGSHLCINHHDVWLTPQQSAVIRALALAQGAVVSRSQLIKAVPGLMGSHALEMTVSRLRRKLPAPLVRTVVKRGYRLDVPLA
ncbi:uroporphyrinogen-III synthase [Kocuria sp.]|uniref:uroporphyrinogen-III synthase n=1 Tax=Kocuria sp. TaxID=1871328 RepID=UPI0026DEF767|nr:uroporphyrinogen-III synthase [Kocuria sp.]MDO5619098.1 uroporphyrinogen-III synthase [Kocuria sp.]